MIIVDVKVVDEDTGEIKTHFMRTDESTYLYDVHEFLESVGKQVEISVCGRSWHDGY